MDQGFRSSCDLGHFSFFRFQHPRSQRSILRSPVNISDHVLGQTDVKTRRAQPKLQRAEHLTG